MFSLLRGVPVKRTLTPRARGDLEGNDDGSYEATGFERGVLVLIREDKLGAGSSGGGDSLVELLVILVLIYSTSHRIEQLLHLWSLWKFWERDLPYRWQHDMKYLALRFL